MIYMYKWKASKLFNRRKITPPHGCIGIQNEISNKLRKQNICILAFHWKCFTIIAQLCFSRRQHPIPSNFESKSRSDRATDSLTTWMNWDNTTCLDLWRNLKRNFPNATLTCCFSAIRMLSLLSFSSPVSSSFQNAMLCLAQPGQDVFTLRWTTWFAENSTSSDEYGLTTAANNQLLRHGFGTGCVCTLSHVIKNQAKWKALWVTDWHVGRRGNNS